MEGVTDTTLFGLSKIYLGDGLALFMGYLLEDRALHDGVVSPCRALGT